MMKRLLIYASILVIVFAVAACGKKEEKKAETKTQIPAQQGQEGVYTGHGVPGPGMVIPEGGVDPHGAASKQKEKEAGIRLGFAYATLGVVSKPIEGFTELKQGKKKEGGQG